MFSLFQSVELVNVREVPLDQIKKISILYISEGIRLREAEGDQLVLKEYFNMPDEAYHAQVSREGGDLIIRHGERPVLVNTVRGYVEVYVPRRYFGQLNVKNISGRISSEGRLALETLSVTNTSGRIALDRIMAGSAVLSSVSGSIYVQELQAEADVHTTSGSIRVSAAAGDGEYKSVSGSVELAYQAVTGDIAAGSTSGRVRLTVPKLLSFEIEASSVSGSVSVPMAAATLSSRHVLNGTVGASPQVHIRLRTISGRIEVLQGS